MISFLKSVKYQTTLPSNQISCLGNFNEQKAKKWEHISMLLSVISSFLFELDLNVNIFSIREMSKTFASHKISYLLNSCEWEAKIAKKVKVFNVCKCILLFFFQNCLTPNASEVCIWTLRHLSEVKTVIQS